MCEPNRRMPLGTILTAAGMIAATVVVWKVLAAIAPFLLPLAAVAVALAVASVPATRWLARRVCYPSWSSSAYKFRPARRVRQTALPARTSLAIEAAKPRVDAVITDVRERVSR